MGECLVFSNSKHSQTPRSSHVCKHTRARTHARTRGHKIPNGLRSYIAVGKNKVAGGRVVDHKPAAKLHKDHVQIPAPLPRGGKEKREKAKATSKERDACEGWFQGKAVHEIIRSKQANENFTSNKANEADAPTLICLLRSRDPGKVTCRKTAIPST